MVVILEVPDQKVYTKYQYLKDKIIMDFNSGPTYLRRLPALYYL